ESTNPERRDGDPNDLLEGMDLLIGLSGPGVIRPESLEAMNQDALVFAMANPTPEVAPEEAGSRVRVMATGRSDYPNQINNVLCFPGIFRGALDVRAEQITEDMKMAAARAIAKIVRTARLRGATSTPPASTGTAASPSPDPAAATPRAPALPRTARTPSASAP